MININDNDYSSPYDESNDGKTKIKESVTKMIKVLLTSVVIKPIIIQIIILIISIMIIIVIIISNNSNL